MKKPYAMFSMVWAEVGAIDIPLTQGMFTLQQCDEFMRLLNERYFSDIQELNQKMETPREFLKELGKRLCDDEDVIRMSKEFRFTRRNLLEEFFSTAHGAESIETYSFEGFLFSILDEINRKISLRELSRLN